MLFSDLRKKQVVNTINGCCLGQISDLILDDSGMRVQGLVVPGMPKGILERIRGAPDIHIPISCIQNVGNDVILARIEGYQAINAKEK